MPGTLPIFANPTRFVAGRKTEVKLPYTLVNASEADLFIKLPEVVRQTGEDGLLVLSERRLEVDLKAGQRKKVEHSFEVAIDEVGFQVLGLLVGSETGRFHYRADHLVHTRPQPAEKIGKPTGRRFEIGEISQPPKVNPFDPDGASTVLEVLVPYRVVSEGRAEWFHTVRSAGPDGPSRGRDFPTGAGLLHLDRDRMFLVPER